MIPCHSLDVPCAVLAQNMRVGVAAGMVHALHDTLTKLSQVKYPFLLIHGDHDDICGIAGSRILLQVMDSVSVADTADCMVYTVCIITC